MKFLIPFSAMLALLVSRPVLAQEPLSAFDRIDVFGNIELNLKKGEEASYLVLQNPEYLKIRVDNHILKISHRQNVDAWRDRIIIEVVYTDLSKLNASAGSVVEHDGSIAADRLTLNFDTGSSARLEVEARNLQVSVGEGSVLRLRGSTTDMDVSATTGGVLKAGDCMATHVEIKVNTGANATIHAEESLDAKASLGGAITYYGEPEKVWVAESLGGSVKG